MLHKRLIRGVLGRKKSFAVEGGWQVLISGGDESKSNVPFVFGLAFTAIVMLDGRRHQPEEPAFAVEPFELMRAGVF